jgi:hypothetical protein
MATAIAIATTSIILTLAMGFLFYLEVYKMEQTSFRNPRANSPY